MTPPLDVQSLKLVLTSRDHRKTFCLTSFYSADKLLLGRYKLYFVTQTNSFVTGHRQLGALLKFVIQRREGICLDITPIPNLGLEHKSIWKGEGVKKLSKLMLRKI